MNDNNNQELAQAIESNINSRIAAVGTINGNGGTLAEHVCCISVSCEPDTEDELGRFVNIEFHSSTFSASDENAHYAVEKIVEDVLSDFDFLVCETSRDGASVSIYF